MSAPVDAFVGLGANLGDAAATVRDTFDRLDATPGVRVVARSGLYRTPAWGVTAQPDFVNAVAHVTTTLPPDALLQALLDIERVAGRDRRRSARWGPRELDLGRALLGVHHEDAVHAQLQDPG